MNQRNISLSSAIILRLCTIIAFAEGAPAAPPHGSTVDMQRAIDSVVSVIVAHENREASEQDCNAAVEKLVSMSTVSSPEILRQILIYRGNALDEYKERASRILLWFLIQSTPDIQVINAIVPLYINETNEALALQAKFVLDGIALKGGENPNYEAFIPYLREHANMPPAALVKYLYRLSPDEAVIAFEKVFSGDTAALKIRKYVEAGNPQGMVELLADGEWWKDLYVAEKALKDPMYRTPEIMMHLQKTGNPLAADAISKIEKEKRSAEE
jgi:hypothetical protein